MLYSEFIKGTGCKESVYNYNVYKDLEVLYMNSDKSKEQIYLYGTKLVDNSKTEAELQVEKEIISEIYALQTELAYNLEEIKYYKSWLEEDKEFAKEVRYPITIKNYKQRNKYLRNQIALLKGIIH